MKESNSRVYLSRARRARPGARLLRHRPGGRSALWLTVASVVLGTVARPRDAEYVDQEQRALSMVPDYPEAPDYPAV